MDEFMHARTMMLLEFGCPPLPIADGQRMETGDKAILNSHDLLSVFLAQAFKGQDPRRNAERKERQAHIEAEYRDGLTRSDGSFASLYSLMAGYTQSYLGTYLLPPFSVQDVRVLPPDHISPVMRQSIREYASALRIAHSEENGEEEAARDKKPQPKKTATRLEDDFKAIHRTLKQRQYPESPAR
jgi:hypothetical protein